MAGKKAKKHPEVLRYEALEERVLFSADAVPGMDISTADEKLINEENTSDAQSSGQAIPESEMAARMSQQAAAQPRWELVLVNDDVTDYEKLVADIQSSGDSRILEVVTLQSGQDGIAQVSEILADRNDLSAVHFIANGADGKINIGSTWISSDTLETDGQAIAEWGKALTQEGDLLFYGCNITADSDGQYLLDGIAALTGADAAGSEDLTGHRDLGGDWDLEYTAGEVETQLAVTEEGQDHWYGALDITTGLVGHWTFDTNANDSSVSSNHGTFQGDAAVDTTPATNKVGGGKLDMVEGSPDFTDDHVDLSSHIGDYAGLSQGTIAAWINTSDGSNQTILSLSDDDAFGDSVTFTISSGRLIYTVDTSTGDSISVSTTMGSLDDGAWHHVAICVDATGNRIYVDGEQLTEGAFEIFYMGGSAATQAFFNDASSLDAMYLGIYEGFPGAFTNEFNGLIDDVRIYNRGLSSSDITELYNFAGGADVTAPTVVNQSMTVAEGATDVALTLSDLQSTDTQADDTTLIYTVGDVTNGTLTINGSGWAAATNDNFTQQDIIDGNVLYTHDGTNTTSDSFTYSVEDPAGNTLAGQTFAITVTAVDDDTPTVVNQSMTVAEGDANVALTTSDLSSTDADTNDATLIYTVTNVSNGTLTINGSGWAATTNDTFTQQDIIDGNVLYTHDGTNTTSDSFTYSVEDPAGNTLAGQTFSITVTAANDAPVVTSATLTVYEGQTVTLSGVNFGITDPDDTSFTYTVSGVSGGYFQLSSTAGTPITTFTSADLTGGLVQFVDDDNEAAPTFSVTVSDGDVDSNTLAAAITYTRVNDAPVLNPIGNQSVNELATLSFTASAADSDLPSDTLTYSLDAASVALGMSIDPDSGLFTWAPTQAQAGMTPSVTITVTDNWTGALTDSETFTIAVNAQEAATPDSSNDDSDNSDNSVGDNSIPSETDIPDINRLPDENMAQEPLKDEGPDLLLSGNLPTNGANGSSLFDEPDIGPTDILYIMEDADTGDHLDDREQMPDFLFFDDHQSTRAVLANRPAFNLNATKDILKPIDSTDLSAIDFENRDLESIIQNGDYDQLRAEIDDEYLSERQAETFKRKMISISAATFSVGIVSYLLRAGSMVAGMISSLPIWRGFDPIVILAGKKKKQGAQEKTRDGKEHQTETFFDDKS